MNSARPSACGYLLVAALLGAIAPPAVRGRGASHPVAPRPSGVGLTG
jgi:hypothetical protein